MKREYKPSAAVRRGKLFDRIHVYSVKFMMGLTVFGFGLFGYSLYQFAKNKPQLASIRRQQIEDEIASKQKEAEELTLSLKH